MILGESYLRSLILASATLVMGVGMAEIAAHAESYTVSITDERITPNVIAVTAHQKTHLTIHNYGKKTHNFVLPAFFIFTPNLPPQQGTTVEFVPEKKGTFSYYSDTGGAPEPGLSGMFQVK